MTVTTIRIINVNRVPDPRRAGRGCGARLNGLVVAVLVHVLVKLYESLLLSSSLSVKEMITEILQTDSQGYKYNTW